MVDGMKMRWRYLLVSVPRFDGVCSVFLRGGDGGGGGGGHNSLNSSVYVVERTERISILFTYLPGIAIYTFFVDKIPVLQTGHSFFTKDV